METKSKAEVAQPTTGTAESLCGGPQDCRRPLAISAIAARMPPVACAEQTNPHCTVIVIGAGITGIGAAYYFGAASISYLILERNSDLGGIWNTHRWHGARCDSDIIKYSFSFKPLLSEHCLLEADRIQDYLRSVAEEFGIRRNIRYDTLVKKAGFDSRKNRWFVHTNRGIFTSQFLFNGNGYFADKPYVPPFPGVERFCGEIVHTCHLDGNRTFADKNVVLIGSGATAVCCAPELSRVSKSLVMLQRSPSYIYETNNRIGTLTCMCQKLHRCGIKWPVRLLRYALQCRDDAIFVGFRRFPSLAKWIFRRHWLKAVGQKCFQEHFRPAYNPWEQRIPVAIGLKEKLIDGSIRLRTGEIDRFTAASIVLKNGDAIPCDVCVLATGLDLDFLKFEIHVDGKRISIDRLNFYKGAMMGSIPNYFHPFGVLHSAWTQRSETVTRFAIAIMSYMNSKNYRLVTLDPKQVDYSPSLSPGYIKRSATTIPRLYGSFNLQSLDAILSFRFDPSQFRFS